MSRRAAAPAIKRPNPHGNFPMQAIQDYFLKDRFAARNEIRLIEAGGGRARARMVVQPWHCNALGTVQGGALFTLADFCFAAACNSHGTVAVAIEATITFMKAVSTGTLYAEAREIAKNFKLGSYAVEVRDEAGDLVAQFHGLAYRKKDPLPFHPPRLPTG